MPPEAVLVYSSPERIGATLRIWSRASAGTEVELLVSGKTALVYLVHHTQVVFRTQSAERNATRELTSFTANCPEFLFSRLRLHY
jgi:hypothetical protein